MMYRNQTENELYYVHLSNEEPAGEVNEEDNVTNVPTSAPTKDVMSRRLFAEPVVDSSGVGTGDEGRGREIFSERQILPDS